jgi:hypothetical protein
MVEQRLKEQEKKMQVEIERRLVVTISQIAKTRALPEVPLDPVISPSARKSSSASIEGCTRCLHRGRTGCLHRRP